MLKINNKIEFENNCWIGIIDSSKFNSSEENRIKAVTDIASITKGRLGFKNNCYHCNSGKEFNEEFTSCEYCNRSVVSNISSKRKKLYNKLLKESAGNPSTPFEFIPVSDTPFNLNSVDDHLINNFYKFGYIDDNHNLFKTNLRATINYTQEIINNNHKEIEDFKIIIGKIPIKVISHLVRHRAFSFMVESSRNKKYLNEVEFWYPSWWKFTTTQLHKQIDDYLLLRLKSYIKDNDIKPEEATMELSDRRLVTFAMAAWKQDGNAWDNLFAVRGKGTGTQSITGIVVDNIKKLIYDDK